MADCLRISGTHASANDRCTILTMVGRRVLIQAFRTLPGNGSNMHDLAQALTRRVDSSFTDVRQRECSSFTAGHTIRVKISFHQRRTPGVEMLQIADRSPSYAFKTLRMRSGVFKYSS